jgi:ABC-type transport system involved in multi-copper enzyme maturation permease subunit
MQRERGWSGPWEDHPGRIVLVLSLLTPIPSLFGLASRDWWNSTILARFGEPGFVWVAAPATWATLIVAAGFCCWASLRGYMRLRDDPDRLGGRKRFETEEFGEEFYWKGFGNPVWTRDVRTRLRHKETTEFIFFASVAVAAGACIPLAMTARDLSDPLKTADAARNVFFWLSMTLVALVTLIGPGLTADAITEERAQGSLELLIATPLTPREILVGKLLGAAGVQLLLVSPSLPLFGLCFLFHGAQGDQVLAVYALVVTSIVVCSFIGLAQSAVCTRSGVAKFFAYLITTFFVALPGGPFWVAAAIAAPGAEMRASLMSGAAVSVVVGVVWLFVLGLLWGNASEALEYHEY